MTIKKKPLTIKKPAASGSAPAAGNSAVSAGGVADRFRLDAPDEATKKRTSVNAKAAAVAFTFGLVALAVAGILTYLLYRHWEFLMPA